MQYLVSRNSYGRSLFNIGSWSWEGIGGIRSFSITDLRKIHPLSTINREKDKRHDDKKLWFFLKIIAYYGNHYFFRFLAWPFGNALFGHMIAFKIITSVNEAWNIYESRVLTGKRFSVRNWLAAKEVFNTVPQTRGRNCKKGFAWKRKEQSSVQSNRVPDYGFPVQLSISGLPKLRAYIGIYDASDRKCAVTSRECREISLLL